MLFVRKPRTTVVVTDPERRVDQAVALAEEQGRASAAVTMLGITAVAVILLLVGYFAWWAPVNQASAEQQATTTPAPVVHERVVHERGTTTIVNTPTPPQIIVKDNSVSVPPPQQIIVAPQPKSGDRVIIDNTDKNGNSPDTGNLDDTPND